MKLNSKLFNQTLFNQLGYSNSNVKIKPNFGIDTSVISISEDLDMVCASDPLSYLPQLGPELSAYLSIHLIANDIITSGVAPQYFQMVLNLQENMSVEIFQQYWKAIHMECKINKIAITGGHTGWVMGQNSTISGGGTMFSIAPKNSLLTSDKVKPNDVIIMTKTAGIAATSILGLQFPDTARETIGEGNSFDWKALFYQISVLKEGLIVSEFNKENSNSIHAMHDTTEGGVLNAVAEMVKASGIHCEIDLTKIPIKKEQKLICDKFNLSPYRIIGAGSLIISVSPVFANELLDRLNRNNILATIIGEFNDEKSSCYLDERGEIKSLETLEVDLYWEAFGNALKNNWK